MAEGIEFRRLAEADLPQLSRWLQTPHVAEWYGTDEGDDPSEAGVRAKYLPYITGDVTTSHHYLILIDGEAGGFIQWYRVGDYPEYQRALQVEPDSISIDVFIGVPGLVHRGIGPRAIRRFLADIAFPDSGAEICHIGPAVANEAAKKAYAKVEFRYLKTVEVPGEGHPEYLMRLTRTDVPG